VRDVSSFSGFGFALIFRFLNASNDEGDEAEEEIHEKSLSHETN
jgi:hypothetical protein